MRSGELKRGYAQRGATYLLLLFVLAVAGAGMAALGEQWALAAQRERETELLFRGQQISQALADWRDLNPPGQRVEPGTPMTLQALLVDERVSPPRHHLRRLYADPFTGQPDWALLLDAEGRINGVSSRSRRPAQRRVGVVLREGADDTRPTVGDWLFMAATRAAPTAAPASAAAGASRAPRAPRTPRPP